MEMRTQTVHERMKWTQTMVRNKENIIGIAHSE
jgi:hypothetical protein